MGDLAWSVHQSLCKKAGIVSMYDASGSIGRRYARADEIGVPVCITVDHQSLEDGTVTVRRPRHRRTASRRHRFPGLRCDPSRYHLSHLDIVVKVEEPSSGCVRMGQASDWTERHRPRSEQLLEGNEVQRRKIRAWLDEWQNGTPKKKGILLIGPPGVGKTTVARAVAEDMGWNVIELNASDARNAAAIRKAAPAVPRTDPCFTTRMHRPRGH